MKETLKMIETVNGADSLKKFLEELKTRDIKKLRRIVSKSLSKFYFVYNDLEEFIYQEKFIIDKNHVIIVWIRNCEDLDNFREFEPVVSFELRNTETNKCLFIGGASGYSEEDVISFEHLLHDVSKNIMKSRSIFHKVSVEEE